MVDTDEKKTGSCLCGAVTYEIDGPLDSIVGCHCSQCRKQSGHFYAATRTNRQNVTIHGDENLASYRASDSATRQFCRVCGSALFWQGDGSANIAILAGSLDLSGGIKMTHHIYCQDKGDYYELDDGLVCYEKSDG